MEEQRTEDTTKMLLVVGSQAKVGVWDKIYPLLSRADEMLCKVDDIVCDVIDGDEFEIWIGLRDSGEIAYCTLCEVHDECYQIHHHCSDDGGCYDWNEIIKSIEERAVALGKSHVYTLGRKGWSRLLKDYKVEKYLYVKRVDN